MVRFLVACALLAACDQSSAEPIASVGAGPIPCNAPMHRLRRQEAAAFVKAGKLDAALELLTRQTCGDWDGMPSPLREQLTGAAAEQAAVLYRLGDFSACARMGIEGCDQALAKEQALFEPASHCAGYETDYSKKPLARAYGIPDQSACLVLQCGDSFLLRDNAKTKLTVDKGNLVESSCNNLRRVSFGRDEILVAAGGRMTDGVTWHPYARNVYKLDGDALVFQRVVHTVDDLEAR